MFNAKIPEFSLSDAISLVEEHTSKIDNYHITSFRSPVPLNPFPHRATYFGIALCNQGHVKLLANLDDYEVHENALIIMGPEVIRTWQSASIDYSEETLFFTESFLAEGLTGVNSLKNFVFFQPEAPKVIQLTTIDSVLIANLLNNIKSLVAIQSARKDDMIRSYILIMLNQAADFYDRYFPVQFSAPTFHGHIITRFKKLLITNYLDLRTVNGYAELLNVSAKHLSETIKANTGKTAGEWIHEIVIMEAKVRLKQTTLSIAQISDALNFSDPSFFGKYFRRYSGLSPAAYRKQQTGQKTFPDS